jgi:hypothetical protein
MIIAVDKLLMIIHHEMRPSSVLKVFFVSGSYFIIIHMHFLPVFNAQSFDYTDERLGTRKYNGGTDTVCYIIILSL